HRLVRELHRLLHVLHRPVVLLRQLVSQEEVAAEQEGRDDTDDDQCDSLPLHRSTLHSRSTPPPPGEGWPAPRAGCRMMTSSPSTTTGCATSRPSGQDNGLRDARTPRGQ